MLRVKLQAESCLGECSDGAILLPVKLIHCLERRDVVEGCRERKVKFLALSLVGFVISFFFFSLKIISL